MTIYYIWLILSGFLFTRFHEILFCIIEYCGIIAKYSWVTVSIMGGRNDWMSGLSIVLFGLAE